MSSVIRPVGPQPPSVYWVRRVVVLVVLVAVVAGVVWLVGGRGGDPGTDGGAPATASTPQSSPTDRVPATPDPTSKKPKPPERSPDATPGTTASQSKSATAAAMCRDRDIKVTTSTDAASYRVGDRVQLRMRITNVSDASCRRDVGSEPNELIVNEGSTRFWSSDDCNPRGSSDVVVLEAGQSYSVSLTWLGQGSSAGCPADAPKAAAGSYSLVGRNGDVLSAPARFTLT